MTAQSANSSRDQARVAGKVFQLPRNPVVGWAKAARAVCKLLHGDDDQSPTQSADSRGRKEWPNETRAVCEPSRGSLQTLAVTCGRKGEGRKRPVQPVYELSRDPASGPGRERLAALTRGRTGEARGPRLSWRLCRAAEFPRWNR